MTNNKMVTPAKSTMGSSSCCSSSQTTQPLNSRGASRGYRMLWIALAAVLIVVFSFHSSSSIATQQVKGEVKEEDAMAAAIGVVASSNMNKKDRGKIKDENSNHDRQSEKNTKSNKPRDSTGTHGESTQLIPNCQPNKLQPYGKNDINDGLKRWSQRDHPSSTVQSHFNCFRKDTLCTYFYPADFFDKKCGIGKDYAHFTEEAEAMRKNNTLWNFMPSVGFPTLSLNHTCLSSKKRNNQGRLQIVNEKNAAISIMKGKGTRTPLSDSTLTGIGYETFEDEEQDDTITCMTERLSMIHVHKAGGSSLHEAFNFFTRFAKTTTQLVRHKFFTPSRSPIRPKLQPQGKNNNYHDANDRLYQFSREALSHATKYPQQDYKPEQHVIFAIVRDPVERFISSIGQALGAQGSTGNHIGPIIMQECVNGKESSRDALKCIAKYVQEHGFWIELHFTPQVIDIAFTTMFADVPIAIFSFRDIKTVLNYFGAGNVRMRNGSKEDYRASSLLTDMSVDDYDEESLKIVCEIYKMDVIMQRSLGMEVERCDPYIPK